jgi:aminopeptidase N
MEMFKVLFFCAWANAFFLNAYANNFCKHKSEVKSTPQRIVSNQQNLLQSAYDAQFHHLNLNIERTNKNISGSVRTIAKVLAAQLDTFAFELHSNLTIDSVICNGTPLAVLNLTHERRAVLPQTFYQNDEIEITIYYRGTPPTTSNNGFGDGFSNRSSPSWGNQISWSLSQPYGAYEWFPCKQALQDKLDSVWVFVTTDSSNRVGSNGLLTNVVSLPNGKKRYEWKSKYPIDYYLISVAVGQYVEYKQYAKPKGYNDSILILNYIYNNPQTLPNFKNYIDSTAQMVELFSELYGLYPFAEEKYGHAMAPLS